MVGRGGDFPFENGGNGGQGWRFKKLDLPRLDRDKIIRAERFFKFYCLSEEDKIEVVAVVLDGEALFWFPWEN